MKWRHVHDLADGVAVFTDDDPMFPGFTVAGRQIDGTWRTGGGYWMKAEHITLDKARENLSLCPVRGFVL